MVDVTEAKRALREEMRNRRAQIPLGERLRLAERVDANLESLRETRKARTFLLFYSFGSEVPTAGMVKRLHSAGCRVLLPFLHDEGMEAGEIRPEDELVTTDYGPKEPGHRVAVDPAEVEVVITPGLAFDREGHRLGYGGGHYDRYLKRLSPRTVRVGIAFAQQVVGSVPAEPEDERVHIVVTDREVIRPT